MNDDELEQHIADAAHQLELAQAKAEASSCFGDMGEVSRCAAVFHDALRARAAQQTPEAIAAWERAKGIAA